MNPAQFAFLTAGPAFDVEIPDDFSPIPASEAPVDLGRGTGARSFVFMPTWLGVPELDERQLTLERRVQTPSGPAAVYKREEEPVIWLIRWTLEDGVLDTHIREEDGREAIDVVLDSAEIDRCGGLPCLALKKPLSRGVSTHTGYGEYLNFFHADRPPMSREARKQERRALSTVRVSRPGDLNSEGRFERDDGQGGWFWAHGSQPNVDALLHFPDSQPDDGRELASQIARSIRARP